MDDAFPPPRSHALEADLGAGRRSGEVVAAMVRSWRRPVRTEAAEEEKAASG
jgi:hypothetical protein